MFGIFFKAFIKATKFQMKYAEEIRKVQPLITDIISDEKKIFEAFVGGAR